MRRCVDANVVLRYLLGDIPEQAKTAHQAIEEGVFLHADVLAEIVYVLGGVYEMPRAELSSLLINLLEEVGTDCRATLIKALTLYSQKLKLDFVDCLLAARHIVEEDEIVTFDKALKRFLAKLPSSSPNDNH